MRASLKRSTLTQFSQAEVACNEAASLMSPLIRAPFGPGAIWVKVKRLTMIQIRACGDFSLISTSLHKPGGPSIRDMVYMSEVQHRVCKEALLSPTYDELVSALGLEKKVAEHKAVISELREKLKGTGSGPKRQALEDEITEHEQWTENVLFNNFTEEIFSIALSKDITDIEKVSRDILIEAAVMAEKGHDNPADHIEGNFTEFNREDINKRAWFLLHEIRNKDE